MKNKFPLLKHYYELIGMAIIIAMLGYLTYQISKPPLINKEIIESLQKSVTAIEAYTSKMAELTESSRRQIKYYDGQIAQSKMDDNCD